MFPARRIHRPTIACVLACALLACAPGVASAAPTDVSLSVDEVAPHQDLRSPDTRDSATRNQSPTSSPAGPTSQDRHPADVRGAAPAHERSFASPDARDAALAQERYYGSYAKTTDAAASRIASRQDLRSPDTRDVADGREYPPTPTVVTLKDIKAPEPLPSGGFDRLAAVAGAAVTFGVILLMTAAAIIITRRRARRDQPVAAI